MDIDSSAIGDGSLLDAKAERRKLSAARLALAVKRARAEAGEAEALLASEPIAIVGMGCRFPGGVTNPEGYWQLLDEGRSGIRVIPEGRWPGSRDRLPAHLLMGGYLEEVDLFDPEFFGIAPKEAHSIDPQQRLLLEVCWEAIADAGITAKSLSDSNTGVFIAIYSSDYLRLQLDEDATADSHTGVGAAHSVAAGRLSFLLNLRGPSMAVDTACSSSLVATHLACQSLRRRESDMALVGASSLKLLPDEVRVFEQWGMLASDGQAKAFDASADGFVPGEGGAMLVLKRLSDAIAHGDRVRGVIRGTAVNHDGRSSVLTAPRGPAQEAVIRAALEDAQVDAGDISYIETHGTGTSLGDPIEVEALDAIYGSGDLTASAGERKQDSVDCKAFLGAVKTNVGHLEAAAGLAGLMKVVLALEHERLPQNLNFKQLNPKIVLVAESRLRFLGEAVSWPRKKGSGAPPRFAGVSAFGLGGTNAHVVVEEAPMLPVAGRAPLPLPAWRRQRYWLADQIRKMPIVDEVERQGLLGGEVSSAFLEGMSWERALTSLNPSWAGDHCWAGEPLWPFAAWLEMARQAGFAMMVKLQIPGEVHIKDFAVHRRLQLGESPVRLQTLATLAGEVKFAAFIDGGWQTFASGYWEAQAGESKGETMRPGLDGSRLDGSRLGGSALDIGGMKRRASSIVAAEEMYRGLDGHGLMYGKTFRLLERVFVGQDFALGELAETVVERQVEAAMAISASDTSALLPTVLDACLQTVQAAVERRGAVGGYLPLSVRGYGGPCGGTPAFAVVRMSAEAGAEIEADVTITDRVGMLIVQISGLRLRRVVDAKTKAPQWQLRWVPDDRSGSSKRFGFNSERAAWVVVSEVEGVADRSVTTQGVTENSLPSLIAHALLRKGVPVHSWKDWKRRSEPEGAANVLLIAGPLRAVTAQLLEIVRIEQGRTGSLTKLAVVTFGACSAVEGESVDPEQAAILGLGRSFRSEYPLAAVQLIDLPRHSWGSVELLSQYLLQCEDRGISEEVALRHGLVLRPELEGHKVRESCPSAQELKIGEPGLLDTLHTDPCVVGAPGRGEIQIECRAHGLNFRDVLMALGTYAGASAALGAECSGVVTECGAETGFAPGDAVMAFAPASLRSIVNVPSSFAWRLPLGMSFAQAATIPVSYLTAHFGLSRLAELKPGQTVLVHSAAGGLGHAAVQVAQLHGAQIIATAGSDDKRNYLRGRGIEHVFDSRSESFAEDVLRVTAGKGVDIVLNSLSGRMIDAGMRSLRIGGVFLEVGKRDIWSLERAAASRPDVQYCPYDLGEEALREPALIAALWDEMSTDFATGRLMPLPFEVYPMGEACNAFRQMASGRHIGKLVLMSSSSVATRQQRTWPERWHRALSEGTVLITGGTGALGLETARWLIAQGARSLVLLSRTGETTAVSALVEQASLNGVRIVTEAADVGDGNQLNAVISRIGRGDAAPLRVVIHAAGEVEDGPLHTQTSRSLESALRTKVVGARLLGELTRDHPLLLTVYYSSIASLVGSAGQAGYASANAFLDGMAEERNARGHYTVSVNWGAWAGDGMAGELSAAMKARIERQGIRLMAPSAALATLEESLVAGLPRAVIADVDWMRFASQFPDGSAAGRFYSRFASSSIAEKGGSYARVGYESAENDLEQRAISPETSTSRAQAEIASIRRGMRSERQGLMEQLVRAAARRVLDLSEGRPIPADLPLQDMGLDSLMALELRNLLASAMDRSLSATLLFDYPSVRKLSTYLLGLLLIEGEEEHSNHVYAVATALGSGFNSELAEMTDEQAEEMLLAELEERRG